MPDERFRNLTELITLKKEQCQLLPIYRYCWYRKGASKGEGLGNKFLANIREVEAIVHVVRL